MYKTKEFPKERIEEIREECGVARAHQTRMELLNLFDDAKDQDDIQSIFAMLDEAEKQLADARTKSRAQLEKEVDAWDKAEHEKLVASLKEDHEDFMRRVREALAPVYASLEA